MKNNWFLFSLIILSIILIIISFINCNNNYNSLDIDRNMNDEFNNVTINDAEDDSDNDNDDNDDVEVDLFTESPNSLIQGKMICAVINFDSPPNDDNSKPSTNEIENTLQNKMLEEFRISKNTSNRLRSMTLSSNMGSNSMGSSKSMGSAGNSGKGRGGNIGKGGSGGRGGNSGRGVGNGGRGGNSGKFPGKFPGKYTKPYPRPPKWPKRYRNRPWRSWWWRSNPQYVYTYPLTNYTYTWNAPIERYSIRIGPKSYENPFYNMGSNFGFTITQGSGIGCGTSGARLNLKYGQTYEFDIYTEGDCITKRLHNQPFFFTTSQIGGNEEGALFDIEPVRNGVIRVTMTNNLPSIFYYQSSNSEYVGGYVFLD